MTNDLRPPAIIAIVGPTAVGKTAVALNVAGRLGGEIVSADSRQIYIGMDIGTAKPTREELSLVPHHLIDIRTPDRWITLAEYQNLAREAIEEILSRQKVPILVGGTGQYLNAVLQGWKVPEVPPDPTLRTQMEDRAKEIGHAAFHAELARVDPAAAHTIDSRNVRRVIRALEVYHLTGRPISELQGRSNPSFQTLQIGLTRPRSELYGLVDNRIDRMVTLGLVDEVKSLLSKGYSWSLPAMSSLGYKQIGMHLRDEISLEEAVAQTKRATRTLVRMQYNWFKLEDKAINWIDLGTMSVDTACEAIETRWSEFLAGLRSI